jgi:hypothetical protein
MSLEKFNPRTTILLLFIMLTAAIRVLLHFSEEVSVFANFSPVGAMALFGGAYFNKQWKAFAFPLLALFFSDLVLYQTVFKGDGNGLLYGEWYWVYGAFVFMTIAGRWILNTVNIKNFILSSSACVFIHWIVTDIPVWHGSKIFPQNLKGYIDCLIVAIPFEWRFLTGTLVYGAVLFGAFEWMKKKYAALQMA